MDFNGSVSGIAGLTTLPLVRSPALAPSDSFHPVLMGPPLPSRVVIAPTILVFDSGVGGLTVYRELVRARPDANWIYAADDALFPYGALADEQLVDRVTTVMGGFIEAHEPDLVVIACNTASTIALAALRQHFDLPFVGTVPAIKPACAASATRRVSVLGTEGTVRREYTRALIRQYSSGCAVNLVGSARLARFAEAELAGAPASDAEIAAEIQPCFVEEGGARTDIVVLACTHYPLLLPRLTALAPWPVTWIDPAPAIARRVLELVGKPNLDRSTMPPRLILTSGRSLAPQLAAALAGFGFTPASGTSPAGV